jgi:hypothetical protein
VLGSINAISRRAKRKFSDFKEAKLSSIKAETTAAQGETASSRTDVDGTAQDLHNPYEGIPTARQLSEPLSSFLTRMDPVSIGPTLENEHWIWIADFHAPLTRKLDSETEHTRHAEFMDRGKALLHTFRKAYQQIMAEAQGRAKMKSITLVREKLKQDILDLALSCGLTSGKASLKTTPYPINSLPPVSKWLLFPPEEHLRTIWSKIAHSISQSRLGPVAKVACDVDGKARPICVYTSDFSDKHDVERVLRELVRQDLLPRDEKKYLYYKCDAYTYLGIQSGNEFGLEASLYSSKVFLNEVTREVERSMEKVRAGAGKKRKLPEG